MLSVTDVITKFLAIVTDTVLQSTENVLVTVLDVFGQLVQGLMDMLTAKLDIPALSWLSTRGPETTSPSWTWSAWSRDPSHDHLQGGRPEGAVLRHRPVHRGPARRQQLVRDPGLVRGARAGSARRARQLCGGRCRPGPGRTEGEDLQLRYRSRSSSS
jgi:hypothetical protein